MQSTEMIFGAGLGVLGGGGEETIQKTEQKPVVVEDGSAHDHEEHFSWYHEHMVGLWISVITALGLIIAAYLNRGKLINKK